MKKTIFFLTIITGLMACDQNNDNIQRLENRIDSLEHKLHKTYKPGLGDFMSSIQVHHAKLWFAGKEANWALADFELDEIKESIEDIQKYKSQKKESKMIVMLFPAIDSVNNAIKQKDVVQFKRSFTTLTNTCNSCHHAADHPFNVITIPETPPFSNQIFKAEKQ